MKTPFTKPGFIALVCGVVAAALGLAVLAGWWLDAAALKTVLPGTVSMKANTALGLALAGVSLVLLSGATASPGRMRTGRGLGLLVVLLGGLSLAEFLFGWQFGIDELLFRDDPDAIATVIPGRMAPSTAACFLLLGLALTGIEWEPRTSVRPAETLALAAALASSLSLAEYALDLPMLYGFGHYTRMAPHTAAGLIALSAGVLLARPALGLVGAFRARRISLRVRLVGLVLLASIPLLLIMLYAANDRHQSEIKGAHAEMEGLARLAEGGLVQAVQAGEQLLHTLSQMPAIARGDAGECMQVFGGILARAPRYTSFFVADAEGRALCHSAGLPKPISYADRAYFQRVRATKRFFAGDAVFGRAVGKPILSLAYPLLDGNGDFRGVLVAGLDLAWFGREFEKSRPDLNIAFTLWAEDGTILYRYPDGEKWVGKRAPEAAITQAVLSRKAETVVVEATGLTGVRSLYAIAGLEDTVGGRLAISVGVARAELLSASERAFSRSLAYFGIVFVLALAAAWTIAEISVRRPLARLVEVSGRLRAGDLKARVAGPHPGGEIGALTTAFNEAAAALEAQAESLRRSNRALRTLSECNQALVRADDEPQLLFSICERIVSFGGYRFAWVGYAEDDAAKSVRPVARAGFDAGYLEGLRITWADDERGRGPAGTAIRSGQPFVVADIASDPRFAPWRDGALARGYASCIGLPLLVEGRAIGSLSLYAAEPGAFHDEEMPLLVELANDLAYGIAALRIRGEREQSRRQLLASKALLDETGRLARIGGWELDVASGKLQWTRTVYEIHEVGPDFQPTVEAAIGFYAPESLPLITQAMRRAIDEGRSYDLELALVTAKGRRLWVRAIGTADREDGKTVRVHGVFQDITERREADARLRLQAAALEAAANAIMITDRDAGILWANKSFCALTGYSCEEVLGQNPRLLKSGVHDAEFYRGMYQTLLGGSIWQGEIVNRYKDGRLGAEEMSITPLRGGDGEITHFIAIKQDITERKRAEQDILDLNASLEQRVAERTRQLEAANRAKSDFLANMSHELRTPLNSIIGFSEMLKDGVLGELDAKQRGFVGDIFDAGRHLLSLINDILDLSKVEAGMLQLKTGAVDLPALLKASTLVVREKALAHRIRLDTRLDPSLDTVLADERKLKQIVYNLLANAVKFTPEGGTVTLFARRCMRSEVAPDAAMPARLIALPPGADREFLAITVADNGIGIAEADLGKLYEPFTQVDSSIARRHAGTGLGLSLVRRLAELHGGTVGVASRPGAGSRFSVWLPYREFTGQGEPAQPPAAARREGGPAPQAAPPSRPAVPLALVIEDDDRMAELIATQLHGEGFAVMRAATAEEGLARAAKRHPQLITLDIFLPHMDGWEFLQRLRAAPKLAATPVVIITISDELDRGLALGARRVLHKPFARDELVAALAGLADARPGGAPARVLVVDDNVKAVELVATVLEAEGCRVLRAYGGAEAIEAAKNALPDLVILDLMMPEVSGFEVARALRETEATARIPILVLTAKDLSAEDHARLNGGVSAILAKANFDAGGLLAELRRALPRRGNDREDT